MAKLDDRMVDEIVGRVVDKLSGRMRPATNPRANPSPSALSGKGCAPSPPLISTGRYKSGRLGVYDDVDSAVHAARAAQEYFVHKVSLDDRKRIIAAFRQSALDNLEELARRAHGETGIGRYEDKIQKNRLVAEKTPGPEFLKTHAETGDGGLMITERAPFGTIGAITPTTNPTETIICNGIGMLSGGNSVVFNVHPGAKETCRWYVQLANEYMQRAGAPEGILSMVGEPTIESAGQLMTHPGIRLVVVTGGPGVVKAAMNSGKRAICGGPGNPPVVVDDTADIRAAGKGIVLGHSFDNNIICTDEKEVFVVSEVADMLKQSMVSAGAAEMSRTDIAKLEKLVVDGDHANKEWVGKDASKIAAAIGKRVPENTRTLLCEVDSEDHPFIQVELLMPVLGLCRVPTCEAGIEAAVRAEHGYGHTASMWSTNIDMLHQMARAMDVSIFIKNASNFAGLGHGGEGWTSFTIASPTGEGLTNPVSFTRERRCTLKDHFRII